MYRIFPAILLVNVLVLEYLSPKASELPAQNAIAVGREPSAVNTATPEHLPVGERRCPFFFLDNTRRSLY